MSKQQLNIAVVGWFHHLNAGDDRIGEILIKILYPHHVVLLSKYNTHLLNSFDLILFTAGFWHPRHGISRNFKAWYKNIRVPYMAVGLGVEKTEDPQCLDSYKYFVEHAEFILVRDNESKEALGGSDKIYVGPDITWFDPFPVNQEYDIKGDVFLNLKPHKYSEDFKDNFTKIKFNSDVNFFSCSPEDTEVAIDIGFNKANIFEFDKNRIMLPAKIIYGMRFHSSVFAQQQAIPHYNIVYHSKVSSLASNYKSHINTSTSIGSVDMINSFLERLNDQLLYEEREQLLTNRHRLVSDSEINKKMFLSKVSEIQKNTFRKSFLFKIKNKIINS